MISDSCQKMKESAKFEMVIWFDMCGYVDQCNKICRINFIVDLPSIQNQYIFKAE